MLGYLSDLDPNLPVATAEYYLAQYFLAPVVVANSTAAPHVLANLHRAPAPGFFESRGLAVEKDLGNGLYLLRKAGS